MHIIHPCLSMQHAHDMFISLVHSYITDSKHTSLSCTLSRFSWPSLLGFLQSPPPRDVLEGWEGWGDLKGGDWLGPPSSLGVPVLSVLSW